MARKSKRMALNEAIRQGQAKIAKGSKTGQEMSTDTPVHAPEGGGVLPGSGDITRKSVDNRSAFILKSKEKASFLREFPQKTKLALLICLALVCIVILVVWLSFLLFKDQPEQNKGTSVVGAVEGENGQGQVRLVSEHESDQSLDSVKSGVSEEEAVLTPSEGDNVIVIFTIEPDRKDILDPVAVFFRRKGIETEIITVSGKAALVTKAGFEQNPTSRGTDGYELVQRVKQLGPVYVEETKDTKFGVKPFQDVYGYKR